MVMLEAETGLDSCHQRLGARIPDFNSKIIRRVFNSNAKMSENTGKNQEVQDLVAF